MTVEFWQVLSAALVMCILAVSGLYWMNSSTLKAYRSEVSSLYGQRAILLNVIQRKGWTA